MAQPLTVGHVCGILCVVREQQNQRSCLICVISFSSQSNLYFTFHSYLSAASTYYYFPCLCSWVSTLGFSSPLPHSWSFSLWFLFLQQSISLFNLMLLSCLSRLCVWFSFSWRLPGKRAGFYLKIWFFFKKKKNITMLVFSPGKVQISQKNGWLLTNYWEFLSSSWTSYAAMTDASAACMLLACRNNCKQSAGRGKKDGAELVERSRKQQNRDEKSERAWAENIFAWEWGGKRR